MALKIKWNDDRVRDAFAAVLLIARERLRRGETAELIEAALDDYREDPAGFKAARASWAPVADASVLTKPMQRDYYARLCAAAERVQSKMAERKTQFSSLLELDNYVIFNLKSVK